MLINKEVKTSKYSPLYDIIIPKDNQLRKINEMIDFYFIYEEVAGKYCHNNGRRAEDPIQLFKYLLLKVIFDLSDSGVVERSRYDMSFKYFLNMSPEEDVIHPSTLTKFRKLRLQDSDLLALLINKTVAIAIAKGLIKTKSIIVDATHTLSRSSPFSVIEVLRTRSKQLRKAVYAFDESKKANMPKKNEQDDIANELSYSEELIQLITKDERLSFMPEINEKLMLLKETITDIKENLNLSQDKDAKLGHKSKEVSFFGYKTHIAMTEERIITAAIVTSGEKGDGPILPALLEMSQATGLVTDVIIGDTAYSGKENLDMAKQQNIKIVAKVNPIITDGNRKTKEFDYNKDANMFVCPAGHMAFKKSRQGKKGAKTNQVNTFYFDVEKCKICPFKDGCYREGAKTKTYSVSIKSNSHQEQIDFQETAFFKDKAKHRYKIEAKNAELKNVHGYDRAASYGLPNMQMQGALTIFAVNIKRIFTLIREKDLQK